MENENWTKKARAKIINTATEIKFKKKNSKIHLDGLQKR